MALLAQLLYYNLTDIKKMSETTSVSGHRTELEKKRDLRKADADAAKAVLAKLTRRKAKTESMRRLREAKRQNPGLDKAALKVDRKRKRKERAKLKANGHKEKPHRERMSRKVSRLRS